jgi:hypothetical protein
MAEEKKKKKEIKTDEIVDRLLQEGDPTDVVKLVGRYLGNNEGGDSFRLYLTEQLNHYLEFPKEATLDAERVSSGNIIVWVKRGTKVRATKTQRLSEEFLRGDIHRSHSGAALAGSALRGMLMLAAGESGCGACEQRSQPGWPCSDPACSGSACSGRPTCPNA